MATRSPAIPDAWYQLDEDETRAGIRSVAREFKSILEGRLGPWGTDALVVRRTDDGELRRFVSNSATAVINEFETELGHPIAGQFISLAGSQEDAIGDGTATTVLLAAALLDHGIELIADGIHPRDVIEGLSIGAQRALEVYDEHAVAIDATERDRERLTAIARTGITNGDPALGALSGVAGDLVEAVLHVGVPETGSAMLDSIDTHAIPGGSITDSEVRFAKFLPRTPVEDISGDSGTGRILLLNDGLEPRELAHSVSIDGSNATAFRNGAQALNRHQRIATRLAEADVRLVAAAGTVPAALATALAEHGIRCIRDLPRRHLTFLKRLTGGTVTGAISPDEALPVRVCGTARIDVCEIDDRTWTVLEAPDPETACAATVLVRGGTSSSVEEAKRRISGGLNALRATLQRPKILPAGGAPEIAAARAVRSLAPSIDGREQLAVEAFADCLEYPPRTLAHNAGLHPIDSVTALRNRHADGQSMAGIGADGSIIEDITASGGWDPLLVRVTALVRAVEFTNDLLTIDHALIDRRARDPLDS